MNIVCGKKITQTQSKGFTRKSRNVVVFLEEYVEEAHLARKMIHIF